jgi:hypothetical protein
MAMSDVPVTLDASSVLHHAVTDGVQLGPTTAPPSELAPTSRRDLWQALGMFAVVAALVWFAVWFGNAHLGHDAWEPHRPGIAGGQLFEGWARWDAAWYRTIVREGYVYYPDVQSSVAFWPSYPIVVKAFSWLFPSIFITGSVLTLVSGASLAVLFRKWAGMFLAPAAAVTALVLLLVYPYGWYQYGAVYADALFVAAAVGAFVLVERDRLFWAGMVGIIATAGRPAGLVVAGALVIRVIERRNATRGEHGLRAAFDPRGLHRSDARILVAFAGVGAWCAFLWVRFGNPLLFATVEGSKGWDQGAGPSTWLKFKLIETIEHHAFSPKAANLVAQGVLVIGGLALVPAVRRRFGWAYALYVLGVCGMALVGTKDFMGSGRYLLACFPLFAVLGDLLASRRQLRLVLVPASLVALLGMAMLFGRGSYLS